MAGPPKKRASQANEPDKPAVKPKRVCLVTCGATAPFPLLVETVMTVGFLTKLASLDYTELVIQFGAFPVARFEELKAAVTTPSNTHNIKISGFAFMESSQWHILMRATKGTQLDCRYDEFKVVQQLAEYGDKSVRAEGVIISHAGNLLPTDEPRKIGKDIKFITGTGTILDAHRIDCPLIIVPNPELMDNHQEELASTMASYEYLVHGDLKNMDKALDDIGKLSERKLQWPPINSGVHRKPGSDAGTDFANYEIPWVE